MSDDTPSTNPLASTVHEPRAGYAQSTGRDLRKLVVAPTASLREAMTVIEREAIEMAFVADESGRVLGTLSDREVRRALLLGRSLDAPVVREAMRGDFPWVTPDVGRAEVLDRMRVLGVQCVPVLDSQGVLCGIHLLYELIGAGEKPNVAVLMAGGKGLRLRPLTESVPKPMLPVAGRPILERLVLQLVGQGIRTIYLSIHYLGEVIERHFGDGERFGCRIEYLRERAPLGTGGAIALLPPSAQVHPVLVMNGDLVTEVDVTRLLRAHVEGHHALSVCVRPHVVEIPFGVATVEGSRLLHLREKPQEQYLVNTGIYAVSREAIELIPEAREFSMPDLVDRCIQRGLSVGAHTIEADWIDVGRHESLRHARGEV